MAPAICRHQDMIVALDNVLICPSSLKCPLCAGRFQSRSPSPVRVASKYVKNPTSSAVAATLTLVQAPVCFVRMDAVGPEKLSLPTRASSCLFSVRAARNHITFPLRTF